MSKQSEAVEPQFSQVHRLIIGDALTVLRSLADESVDLCVTSSPYYGLRDYGANCSTVWGGVETCEHQWISETVDFDNLRKGKGAGSTVFNNNDVDAIRTGKEKTSNFCLKCDAWRGQLGLEPTFQLFIDHLLLIFKEVKRVLKSTGSLYFNIGDSYSGSGGAGGDYDEGGMREGQPKWKQGKVDLSPKCLIGIPERLMIRLIDDDSSDIYELKKGYILTNNNSEIDALQRSPSDRKRKIRKGDIPNDLIDYFQLVKRNRWVCRNKCIWYKRNHMPSSVQDRYANSYEPVLFFSKQSEKDLLWRNALTKEWVDVKPVQKYVENGELHDSYRWWCHRCKASGDDFKGRRKHKQETGHRTEGRKPLWRGFDCYFDLDAIRVPHTVCGVTDKRPMGVLRQKLYKGSRYNKSSDPHLAQYQLHDSVEETEEDDDEAEEEYGGKNQVADPQSNHRRANLSLKKKRKQDNVPSRNASTYEGFNDRWREKEYDGKAAKLGEHASTRRLAENWVAKRIETGEHDPVPNALGKNPGDFMDVTTQPFKESHFAVYPEALITPFIKASCPKGGVVLDPFGGSGTTAKVARDLGRSSICIEINADYESLWHNRLDTSNTLDIKYVVEKQVAKKV